MLQLSTASQKAGRERVADLMPSVTPTHFLAHFANTDGLSMSSNTVTNLL